MRKDLRILLLYASYGNGHLQVTHALNECFRRKGITQVTMTDLFAEAYPLTNKLTKFLYIKSFTLFPQVYGWLYYGTKKMKHNSMISKWFHSFGVHQLKRIIEKEKPDLIINTFPMLAIAQLKKNSRIKLPTYTVLTDFELHNRWVHNEINKFYVASEDLKEQVAEFGIPQERIEVSGIPIKHAFTGAGSAINVTLHQRYGLSTDPLMKTVLLMAGSYGVLPNIKLICQQLVSYEKCQIILVCGKNTSLQAEMETAFANHPRVILFGYFDQIHELMSIATCVVTKPGGITISEAISFCLPMLLYRPVPGQERENANYLNDKEAALISYSAEQLVDHIRLILEQPDQLAKMRHAILQLRKANSTDIIVTDILKDMDTIQEVKSVAPSDQKREIYEYVF